jgi:hypothetical protein
MRFSKPASFFKFFIFLVMFTKLSGFQYLLSLFVHEALYKKNVARLLDPKEEGQLKIFEFTSTEYMVLEWEEEGEFERNGIKYDVKKRVVLPNGSIRFYCWVDQLESALHSMVEEEQPNEKGKTEQKVPKEEYLPICIWQGSSGHLCHIPPVFVQPASMLTLFMPIVPIVPPELV